MRRNAETRRCLRPIISAEVSIDPFGQAELRYRELIAGRRAGLLDPTAYRAAMRDLRVEDADGVLWSLGPANGAWYRRERG